MIPPSHVLGSRPKGGATGHVANYIFHFIGATVPRQGWAKLPLDTVRGGPWDPSSGFT